jgi:seryl-tRNA(Sec) selenium transferase
MSRAFVKEVEYEINDLPDRPVSTHPNYVTAEGLAAIERTLSRFEAANKAAIAKNDRTAMAATQRELRYWIARRSTAKVVEPTADKSKVQFGATVTHSVGIFMRALMGLIKDRHGTYYARHKVPERLQEAVARILDNGKARQVWLKKSLGTKRIAGALRVCAAARRAA